MWYSHRQKFQGGPGILDLTDFLDLLRQSGRLPQHPILEFPTFLGVHPPLWGPLGFDGLDLREVRRPRAMVAKNL